MLSSLRRDRLATAIGALGVVWGVGQLLRETFWLTGLCFFLPSPVVALTALVLGAFAWRRSRRGWALAALVLALPPLAFTLTVENRLGVAAVSAARAVPAHSPVVRVVHWNACRGCLGLEGVRREISRHPADLYVISETPPDMDWQSEADRWGGRWQVAYRFDAAVIGRGALRAGPLREQGEAWTFPVEWAHAGRTLRLLVVDLTPRLVVARRPMLDWVRSQVVAEHPDVVIGDFNTPRRAWGLSPLAPGYVHAYDARGRGWSYTWPVPVPFAAIDQCLAAPGVEITRYRLASTRVSDHRLQEIELIPQSRPGSAAR